MNEKWPVELRFCGLGGQGLVTMGAVLAQAGARAGLNVAASQSYGSRARGGATRSDVILATDEVDFPHVHSADLLLVLAQEAYELYRLDMKEGGLILVDDFFVSFKEQAGVRQMVVPATAVAMEKAGSKMSANFVMLGTLMGYTGLVDRLSLEKAICDLVRERFLEVNMKAFGLGWQMGLDLRDSEAGPWR
jgi:2-oxoglutarate ferredoxin oxidoreductase subunit gamma